MHRLFFILILWASQSAYAVEVPDLFQASSPVASRGDDERQAILPVLLRQVVVKLVGDRQAVASTDISDLVAQATRFVQQYEYQQINQSGDDLTQPEPLRLVVTFKPETLRQAILDLGLPLWGASRPEILVWLAVDTKGKRHIVSADEDSVWTQSVKHAASSRGLPVILPVMDLQEQRLVQFEDIVAGWGTAIEQASQRYAAPIIVTAITHVNDAGAARIDWRTKVGEESVDWHSHGQIQQAVKQGLDQLADKLAAQLAQYQTFTQAYPVVLQVSHVTRYADYVRLENYLKSLQYVSHITVNRVAGDTVHLTLSYTGNMEALKRLLAIDHVLIADHAETAGVLRVHLAP